MTASVPTTDHCARSRGLTRAVTVVAAAGATHTVWAVAHHLLGIDLLVEPGTTVTPAAVLIVTIGVGLAGWGLLGVLERFTRRAAKLWSWIAGAVLLVSLAGPITSGTGPAATATLTAMHLATGAVLIPLLTRSSMYCASTHI